MYERILVATDDSRLARKAEKAAIGLAAATGAALVVLHVVPDYPMSHFDGMVAISPQDVARIEILPHGRRLRHTDTPLPQSPLEAKFSVQYVVARALLDGSVRLKDFEGEAHADPAIHALLAVTEARPHPVARGGQQHDHDERPDRRLDGLHRCG